MVKMNMEKLMPFYDAIETICIQEYESAEYTKPHDFMEKLMDIPGMPMHCPPHHYMMPALLLTEAAKKKDISRDVFEEWLAEAKDRALNVLGGFCGWFGNCGAAVGTGIFLSIFTETNPHSRDHWAQCQEITGTALLNISKVDGPRCCKRNSMIALATAIDMIREYFNLDLEQTDDWKCKYYCNNPDCKKEECPFYHPDKAIETKEPVEILVPERMKPTDKDGTNCRCMDREHLIKYKSGVVHWLVEEGSFVTEDSPICEMEIDKKIFVINAPASGILTKKCAEEAEEFPCKNVLGIIE